MKVSLHLSASLLFAIGSALSSQSAGQTVIGFQGFEGNGTATLLEESGLGAPGLLTEGQQLLELQQTSETLPNGNPVFEFIQPSETFNPDPEGAPLPAQQTGRVFDSGQGLPWRLKWGNSRVTEEDIINAVAAAEGAEELRLALLGFPVDLTFIPNEESVSVDLLTGPVVPGAYDPGTGAIDLFNLVTFPISSPGGLGDNGSDGTGVSGPALLTELDGDAPSTNPEGSLAFFAVDADGVLELEFDPVDASGFDGLQLTFQLAAGGNSNTSFSLGDSFVVEVNDQQVFDLTGSGATASPDPATGEVDPLDVFATGAYFEITVNLAEFAGESSVQVSFLFDNNNDGGNNFDAFAIDDINIIGLDTALAIPGDYNGDGTVNSADYTVFRENEGQDPAALAPGSRGPLIAGEIGEADFLFWVENFGNSVETSSTVSVPEPAAATLVLMLVATSANARRRAV